MKTAVNIENLDWELGDISIDEHGNLIKHSEASACLILDDGHTLGDKVITTDCDGDIVPANSDDYEVYEEAIEELTTKVMDVVRNLYLEHYKDLVVTKNVILTDIADQSIDSDEIYSLLEWHDRDYFEHHKDAVSSKHRTPVLNLVCQLNTNDYLCLTNCSISSLENSDQV